MMTPAKKTAEKPGESIADQIAALQEQIASLESLQAKEGAQAAADEFRDWLGKAGQELDVDTLVTMLAPVPHDVLRRATGRILTSAPSGGSSGGTRGGQRAERLALDDVAAKLPNGEFKLSDLAAAIDRNPATTRNYLNQLVENGTVGVIGDDPNHSGKGKAPKIYAKA